MGVHEKIKRVAESLRRRQEEDDNSIIIRIRRRDLEDYLGQSLSDETWEQTRDAVEYANEEFPPYAEFLDDVVSYLKDICAVTTTNEDQGEV